MKVFRFLSSVLLMAAAGCAPHHLVAVSGNQVSLSLQAPDAGTVYFLSSADDFQPHPMRRGTHGRWLATMPAGREFSYFYLVDGQIHVPDCRDRELDDFGGSNCLYQP